MMNCGISPFLFVGAIENVEKSDEKWTSDSSSFRSFYEYHHSRPVQNRCWWFTTKVLWPFHMARMKAKLKKSRSLSSVSGSLREVHLQIGGDTIPTVREKPVQSLGYLYQIPQTDWHRGTEVQKVALKGLKSIDKTCLPKKMKALCYQHDLQSRLLWSLQIYEIALSRVERIQQYKIQNWEITPSYNDERLSRRCQSEGVSRNKIRYEVVGR